jgi:hypothetical protein
MSLSFRNQDFFTMTRPQLRRSVSFSEEMDTVQEIQPVLEFEKTLLYYNSADFQSFKVQKRLRREKRIAKRIDRLINESKQLIKASLMNDYEVDTKDFIFQSEGSSKLWKQEDEDEYVLPPSPTKRSKCVVCSPVVPLPEAMVNIKSAPLA